ncbi:CDP-alcohol phosphatidyltransferase family protein, partial [bacterium]|nr:CDP-alcohol phosphatidyltransferase family protein [bacterium]
ANYMRGFALRQGQAEEGKEINRLRTMIAAPVGTILYAYAFHIPDGMVSFPYQLIQWVGNVLPLRSLFFIEILFLILNFGSIAAYCRKYGTYCLDELCMEDEVLRRKILSFFPNALTVMNAMMGGLAIFFAFEEQMREAYLILIGAAVFDKMDGALARKLGLTNPLPNQEVSTKKFINLGGILDDISDGVSFCIAPAIIFFDLMSRSSADFLQYFPYQWIAIAYAVLGLVRLVYFTLDQTPIPGFFKGLPTPAAALFISAPFIMLNSAIKDQTDSIEFWSVFCVAGVILAAILMNAYPIRYVHFGRLMGRQPWVTRFTVLLVLGTVVTPYFGHVAFIYLFLYILSPLISWRISMEVASSEN